MEIDPAPWTRAQKWTFAALVVLMLGSLPFTVVPWYEQVNDAALYIHTARSILSGDGYSYLGTPFVIRPPGWSLLLTPFAAHPVDFGALHTMVSLFGAACVTLMFAYYRPRLGTAVSAALCVAVWVNPLFQELCNQAMSDVPGAALMFAALLLERRATRRPSLASSALVGLAVAVGLYVRSVNVVLVPAILCARLAGRFLSKDPERGRAALRLVWPVLAIPVLAWAPWSLRNARADVPAPPEQVYLHSYEAAMWHEHPAFPESRRLGWDEILGRVPEQLDQLLPLIGSRLTREEGGLAVALALLGLACSTVILIRRRSAAEFLTGGILASLSIYFAFKPRLALPLFLLVLPAVCEVLVWLGARSPLRSVATWVVTALLVLAAGFDVTSHEWRRSVQRRHEKSVELLEHVERQFPGDAPLAAPLGWHLGVHTSRPVYSLQIVGVRKGPEQSLTLIGKHGAVATLVNLRAMYGTQYASGLRRIYAKHERVGDWVVFDTR